MNEVSSRLVQGLLIGVGVVITIVICISLWAFFIFNMDDWEEYVDWKEYSVEAKLSIADSRRTVRNDELVILASLENNGSDSWSYIDVEVELFDANGLFLDECTHTIDTILTPGNTENFKMFCSSCKDIESETIDSHVIKITSAGFYLPESDDED